MSLVDLLQALMAAFTIEISDKQAETIETVGEAIEFVKNAVAQRRVDALVAEYALD